MLWFILIAILILTTWRKLSTFWLVSFGILIVAAKCSCKSAVREDTKLYNNGICPKCGRPLYLWYHKSTEDERPVFDHRCIYPIPGDVTIFKCDECYNEVEIRFLKKSPFYYEGFIEDKITEDYLYRINSFETQMGISDTYWIQGYDKNEIMSRDKSKIKPRLFEWPL